MATFGEQAAHEPNRVEKIRAGILSSGSMALAIGGAAAIVLTIIGLSSLSTAWSTWMVTFSTVIVGVALVLEGAAIAGRQMQLLSRTGGTIEQTEMAGGLTAEFLSGCAGLTLGIIALFGVYPVVLTACALIVFGSALVFGSRSGLGETVDTYRSGPPRSDVGRMDLPRTDVPTAGSTASVERPVEQQLGLLFSPVYGAHVMVGLACMALGIVALSGVRPLVLVLTGMLTIGFVLFLGGTALATRFMYRLAKRY